MRASPYIIITTKLKTQIYLIEIIYVRKLLYGYYMLVCMHTSMHVSTYSCICVAVYLYIV